MKTRYLGKCCICEGDFKLNGNLMVHHGFLRPGDGMIHGDCFAVNMAPYELSCEPCKLYKTALIPLLADQEARLQDLKSGKVEWITDVILDRSCPGGKKVVQVTQASDPYKFAQLLKTAIFKTERRISLFNDDIARMDKLVAQWTLQPVRTIEEEEAKIKVDREARKAVKEEARQAKIAKKVAFYQGRIDSAFKKKKADSLRDLFEAVSRASYDLKLTPQELFALVDRSSVWIFFGLVIHSGRDLGGYRDDINKDTLTTMWKHDYWPGWPLR